MYGYATDALEAVHLKHSQGGQGGGKAITPFRIPEYKPEANLVLETRVAAAQHIYSPKPQSFFVGVMWTG